LGPATKKLENNPMHSGTGDAGYFARL